jgi:hypothetical protein
MVAAARSKGDNDSVWLRVTELAGQSQEKGLNNESAV